MKKFLINFWPAVILICTPIVAFAEESVVDVKSDTGAILKDTETFVCTVTAVDSMYGETRKVNIYLLDTDWGGKMYIGREVVNGHEKSVYGEVYFNDDSKYKYWVKTGMVGICYFNTTKLNDKYVKHYY